jgi:hypothetical protein
MARPASSPGRKVVQISFGDSSVSGHLGFSDILVLVTVRFWYYFSFADFSVLLILTFNFLVIFNMVAFNF